jgi:hypothetical protein
MKWGLWHLISERKQVTVCFHLSGWILRLLQKPSKAKPSKAKQSEAKPSNAKPSKGKQSWAKLSKAQQS